MLRLLVRREWLAGHHISWLLSLIIGVLTDSVARAHRLVFGIGAQLSARFVLRVRIVVSIPRVNLLITVEDCGVSRWSLLRLLRICMRDQAAMRVLRLFVRGLQLLRQYAKSFSVLTNNFRYSLAVKLRGVSRCR